MDKAALEKELNKFKEEIGDVLIATGIVSIDGAPVVEVYGALESQFNPQRASTIFAMLINVLNKSLSEIYESKTVQEILISTETSYFTVSVIGQGDYFHGTVVSDKADIKAIRELTKKYEPLLLQVLK